MASASRNPRAPPRRQPPDRRRRRVAGRRARSGRPPPGVQLRQSPGRPDDLHDRGRHEHGPPDRRGRGRRAHLRRPASLQEGRRRSPTPCSWSAACGSRSVRDAGAVPLAEEDGGRGAADRRGVRRRLPARGGRAAPRAPRHRALEVRPRAGPAISGRARRARPALGQGREDLHVGRLLRGHRSRAGLGGRGLRRRPSPTKPRASWCCSCGARVDSRR